MKTAYKDKEVCLILNKEDRRVYCVANNSAVAKAIIEGATQLDLYWESWGVYEEER